MDDILHRMIWVLTGGKNPDVNLAVVHRKSVQINNYELDRLDIPNQDADLAVTSILRDYTYSIQTNRMTIEGIRPVNIVIPFHLQKLQVKGLTLHKLKVITRIKRFIPRLVIESFDVGIKRIIKTYRMIPRELQVAQVHVRCPEAVIIPGLTIPLDISTSEIAPEQVPGYYVSLRPSPFTSFHPSAIVTRRNGVADSLKVPRDEIELISIFRDVEVTRFRKIDYDRRTRKLKLYPEFGTQFMPEIRDVIVAKDNRTGKIHIGKFTDRRGRRI